MKIIYIANIRIPTSRAHGLQVAKTCEALKINGVDLSLVIPNKINPINEEIFQYYGLKAIYKITKLNLLGLFKFSLYGSQWESVIFYSQCFLRYLFLNKNTIIYSRDAWPLLFFSLLGKTVCFESHSGREDWITRQLIKRKNLKIVVITNGIKDHYTSIGVQEKNIHVAPDGVDMELFSIEGDKKQVRKEMDLPLDQKIVMYVGSVSFYDWKGSDLFLESSKEFPEAVFVSVGGKESDLESIKIKYPNSNLILIPQQPNLMIPKYLNSADVLVLPNRGNNEVSLKYTSPMKLFEYMASGNVIVASNLPSIREILTEDNAVFFEPEIGGDLNNILQKVLYKIEDYSKLGYQSKIDARGYDWQVRAKKIENFLENSY